MNTPLRGNGMKNLKITHDTVMYIENDDFGVAEFVFQVILTVTLTSKGPQEARTRKHQNPTLF